MGLTPIMSTIGRLAYSDGKKDGERKGERKGLIDGLRIALEVKFGEEGLSLNNELKKIKDIKRINRLANKIITASDVEEIKQLISSK